MMAARRTKTAPANAWQPVKNIEDAGRSTVDLTRGYLPVIAVIALLMAAVTMAYEAGGVMAGYTQFQHDTAARFAAMETQLKAISDALADIRSGQIRRQK